MKEETKKALEALEWAVLNGKGQFRKQYLNMLAESTVRAVDEELKAEYAEITLQLNDAITRLDKAEKDSKYQLRSAIAGILGIDRQATRNELADAVISHFKLRNKPRQDYISCVKLVRLVLGIGLREAKMAVDEAWPEASLTRQAPAVPIQEEVLTHPGPTPSIQEASSTHGVEKASPLPRKTISSHGLTEDLDCVYCQSNFKCVNSPDVYPGAPCPNKSCTSHTHNMPCGIKESEKCESCEPVSCISAQATAERLNT